MQRRVFDIGGRPFLIAREDGFYETAGTLLALIASQPVPEPAPLPPQAPPPVPAPAVESEAPTPPAPEPPAEPAEEIPAVPAAPQQAVLPLPEPAPPARRRAATPAAAPQVQPLEAFSPLENPDVAAAMKTIAAGYASGRQLETSELSELLTSLHQTLSRLSR